MLINADQIRAARALKNWSQADLAERTGLAVPTVANIELGKQIPGKSTIEKIIKAFSFSGVRFTETGVEKSQDIITTIRGYYEYYNILDDACSLLKKGDEILLLGADAKRSPEVVIDAEKRLLQKGIIIKTIICEGDIFLQNDPKYTRWIPKKYFTFKDVITIYANKVVTTIPAENLKADSIIQIIENDSIAENHRNIFSFFWDHAKPVTNTLDVRDFKNPMLEHYTPVQIEKLTKDFLTKKKGRT